MSDTAIIAQKVAQDRISEVIRMHAGEKKPVSVEMLASQAGIKLRTLQSYHQRETAPSAANLLSLFAVMPEDKVNMILDLAGLTGARRIDADHVTHEDILTAVADELREMAHEHADGMIDHIERRQRLNRLPGLINKLVAT